MLFHLANERRTAQYMINHKEVNECEGRAKRVRRLGKIIPKDKLK